MPTKKNPHRDSFTIVQQFLSSKTTQKAFCREHRIALSTLQYWLRRQRRSQPQTNAPVFLPLAVSSAPEVDGRSYDYAIEYPNGVTIRLSGPVNASLLIQLIQSKGI